MTFNAPPLTTHWSRRYSAGRYHPGQVGVCQLLDSDEPSKFSVKMRWYPDDEGGGVVEPTTTLRWLICFQLLDEQVNAVYDLECFAHLYAQQEEWARAACLLGAVEGLQEALGTPRSPVDQPEFEQVSQELKTQLSDAELLSAQEKGRTMSLEQAVSYALNQIHENRR